MELAVQIKEHRTQLGMSQDELAARVYVSRQTISNWECDKTYPDVQSLLLLSNVFGTTVDALIKGDVETMEKILNNDVRRLGVLSAWMTVLLIAAVVLLFCTAWQYFDGWGTHIVPTAVMTGVAYGAAMVIAVLIERIKKRNDLVTYQEISAFWRGEDVDRTSERGHKLRALGRWSKVLRVAFMLLVGALVGGALGYFMGFAADMLAR